MTEPIKPSDVVLVKNPAQVIEVFNELIQKNWDGKEAIINTDKIANIIAERMQITRGDVFIRGYLDIEDAYREKGWNVVYDKPGPNEPVYVPFFCFSKKAGDKWPISP